MNQMEHDERKTQKQLTVAAILKYKPQRKRREIRDSLGAGLHLIIQPSGVKSWAMRFRRRDGKSAKFDARPREPDERGGGGRSRRGASLTLGQARVLSHRIANERATGVDVVAEYAAKRRRDKERERATGTFGAAVPTSSLRRRRAA